MAPAVSGRRAGRGASGAARSAAGCRPRPGRRGRAAAADAGGSARGGVADARCRQRSGARRSLAAPAGASGAGSSGPRPTTARAELVAGGRRRDGSGFGPARRHLAARLARAGVVGTVPRARRTPEGRACGAKHPHPCAIHHRKGVCPTGGQTVLEAVGGGTATTRRAAQSGTEAPACRAGLDWIESVHPADPGGASPEHSCQTGRSDGSDRARHPSRSGGSTIPAGQDE